MARVPTAHIYADKWKRQGRAWRGKAWRGKARQGKVGSGWAGRGEGAYGTQNERIYQMTESNGNPRCGKCRGNGIVHVLRRVGKGRPVVVKVECICIRGQWTRRPPIVH